MLDVPEEAYNGKSLLENRVPYSYQIQFLKNILLHEKISSMDHLSEVINKYLFISPKIIKKIPHDILIPFLENTKKLPSNFNKINISDSGIEDIKRELIEHNNINNSFNISELRVEDDSHVTTMGHDDIADHN